MEQHITKYTLFRVVFWHEYLFYVNLLRLPAYVGLIIGLNGRLVCNVTH
jgi:hypothetical protein